jgi:hypothetical protein
MYLLFISPVHFIGSSGTLFPTSPSLGSGRYQPETRFMTVVGIVSWRTSHKTEQRHKLTMDSSHFEIDVVTPVFSLWPKFARSKIPSRIPFALPIHGWVEGRWTYVWFSLRKLKKKDLARNKEL